MGLVSKIKIFNKIWNLLKMINFIGNCHEHKSCHNCHNINFLLVITTIRTVK